MRISAEEINRVLSVPTHERRTTTLPSSHQPGRNVRGREATQMDVSTTAQEIVKVKKHLAQLPDVREDRVQALKAQIENGTYYVSGEEIADLIIRRTLADNTAL